MTSNMIQFCINAYAFRFPVISTSIPSKHFLNYDSLKLNIYSNSNIFKNILKRSTISTSFSQQREITFDAMWNYIDVYGLAINIRVNYPWCVDYLGYR